MYLFAITEAADTANDFADLEKLVCKLFLSVNLIDAGA